MKVIFFSGSEHRINSRLFTIVEGLTSLENIEYYNSIQILSKRLKIDTSDISIILLTMLDKESLSELLTIRPQLIGHRIIAVLPDQDDDTLSKAHSLYPRYISYQASDFEDLKAVIDKMLLYLDVHSKQIKIKRLEQFQQKQATRMFMN